MRPPLLVADNWGQHNLKFKGWNSQVHRGFPGNTANKEVWLWTNGVDTNGAAAKIMHFDRLGKKVRPAGYKGR